MKKKGKYPYRLKTGWIKLHENIIYNPMTHQLSFTILGAVGDEFKQLNSMGHFGSGGSYYLDVDIN